MEILTNAWQEVEFKLETCHATSDAYIEGNLVGCHTIK
jgi:hypothetical protein